MNGRVVHSQQDAVFDGSNQVAVFGAGQAFDLLDAQLVDHGCTSFVTFVYFVMENSFPLDTEDSRFVMGRR
jgi:hypothetical protein